ncbi:NADH-ubiquinone oxidoreductase [Beauveria brongniartii RCEF 3172]|uniref:NADH-ubiquinone oxidoreductase n=1 Tax=Beauveria brongniartii RCEF 3172 TaxID=1081107 RepID=A0A167BCB2_9HYPO|nr:NADH-ubiquinone oxidoreductase [Beauveria brongniartii RCEF 3172]
MSGKRKRDDSSANVHLPPPSAQAINPHSYPPAKLAQFAVAGLSDADEDPTQDIKYFPHRGFSHKPTDPVSEPDYETGLEDGTDDDDGAGSKSKRAPDAHRRHLAVLTRAMHQFLSQGSVAKAARAFGLALQLRPYSRPLDIRHDHLWALGAEVIMREGEEQRNKSGNSHKDSSHGEHHRGANVMRWGSAANMNKLRNYLEMLIQQYPYDHRTPKKISALHFSISLYSAEIYNIYSEHTGGLSGAEGRGADDSLADESLADESLADDDGPDPWLETLLEDESFHASRPRRREEEGAASNPKDKVRLRTLAAIKAVVARMDAIMRESPYNKSHEMLRLRAAASLFMADLAVPFDKTAALEGLHDVNEQRRRDIEVARRTLQIIVQSGGNLDEVSRALAEADVVDEAFPIASEIYTALPIREA